MIKTIRVNNFNQNDNSLNREYLLNLLKEYKNVLNNEMIDYLNSLIELEFSAIRNYISEDNKNILTELNIYRKIVIYNVYSRALKILKNTNDNLDIEDNFPGFYDLAAYIKTLNKKKIPLFYFDYNIDDNDKITKIGSIDLNKSLDDLNIRDKELDRIMNILDNLYNATNPYSSRPGIIGGPGSNWYFEHQRKIKKYESLFNKLDSKKELTDEERLEIELTNKYCQLLLEDYGLEETDFKEKNSDSPIPSLSELKSDKSLMSKTLIKKLPGININYKIKYL